MDFSFAEFAIIGIVALLVIGPDKLPGLARTAGMWVGKVRGFINSVKSEIDAELKIEEIKNAVKGGNNSLHEISEIIKDTRSQFQNSVNPNASIKEAIDAPVEPDNKQEYLVKAIPDEFDEEDDAAHHDVEDDFVDDYNSDFEIEEIETTTIEPEQPKVVKKAKAKTKAKKKVASKKTAKSSSTSTKKKTKKKTTKNNNP